MEFCYESKSTISMEFQTRTITLQGKLVKDQIWESRKVISDFYLFYHHPGKKIPFCHPKKWISFWFIFKYQNRGRLPYNLGDLVKLQDPTTVHGLAQNPTQYYWVSPKSIFFNLSNFSKKPSTLTTLNSQLSRFDSGELLIQSRRLSLLSPFSSPSPTFSSLSVADCVARVRFRLVVHPV